MCPDFLVTPVLTRLHITLALVLATRVLQAQPVGYLERTFTTHDGLPSNRITKLYQDKRGFLWTGTQTGLSRYDGHAFVNYYTRQGLPANHITSLQEDNKGTLWVGTVNGLAWYDGARFHAIPLPVSSSEQQSITGICSQGDTLWFSMPGRLFCHVSGHISELPLPTEVTRCSDLCYTPPTGLLMATNTGIYRINGNQLKPVLPQLKRYVLHMAVDKQQRIWATSFGTRVYCWTGNRLDSITMPEYMVHIRSSGNQVFVCGTSALYEITPERPPRKHISCSDNPTFFISDFCIDHENQFWIGSLSGLACERSNSFRSYSFPSGSIAALYSLSGNAPRKPLLAGGLREVFAVQGDSLVPFIPASPLLISDVSFLAPYPSGGWLIGQNIGKLLHVNNNTVEEVPGCNAGRSFSYAIAPDSSVWVGADNRICHIMRNKVTTVASAPGLQANFLSTCLLGHDSLLLGTPKGLYLFAGNTFTHVPLPGTPGATTVYCIKHNRKGQLLIGTSGQGLLVARLVNGKLIVDRTLSATTGPGSDFVQHVHEDGSGQLWLLCSNGVYRVQNYLSEHPRVEYINRTDGIPDNFGNTGDICEQNGQIYLLGEHALVSLPYNTVFASSNNSVRTSILGLASVSDRSFSVTDSLLWNNPDASITVPYAARSLRFSFTGISLARPDKVQYTWWLEGFDADWNAPSKLREAMYTNLPPGRYVFHVKAGNQLAGTEGQERTLIVTISTPYWLSWWFRGLLILGLGAFIYSIYRWRMRDHLRRQQLRLETDKEIAESRFMAFQARMNPHFMFNSLNAIQYFITNNDKQSTLSYLSKFARLLRQILDNSRESKITIESELAMLRSYLEMENMRFENKFSYSFHVHPSVDVINTEIPGMIIQPFVENAIIHGLLNKTGTGSLRIEITRTETHIVCTVEDDGIGRTRATVINAGRSPNHRSHGMSIALNRIELLNTGRHETNSIEICDLYPGQPDTGTRVIIRLPLT